MATSWTRSKKETKVVIDDTYKTYVFSHIKVTKVRDCLYVAYSTGNTAGGVSLVHYEGCTNPVHYKKP